MARVSGPITIQINAASVQEYVEISEEIFSYANHVVRRYGYYIDNPTINVPPQKRTAKDIHADTMESGTSSTQAGG